jgi:hypothetical protein
VASDHDLCCPVSVEAAHRSQPALELAVIGLDRIVRRYERWRCRRCPCRRRCRPAGAYGAIPLPALTGQRSTLRRLPRSCIKPGQNTASASGVIGRLACSGPRHLSDQGKPADPGTSLLVPPGSAGDTYRRLMAHYQRTATTLPAGSGTRRMAREETKRAAVQRASLIKPALDLPIGNATDPRARGRRRRPRQRRAGAGGRCRRRAGRRCPRTCHGAAHRPLAIDDLLLTGTRPRRAGAGHG